ncbi:unnamed protein product [Rotaria sp. Silwood1]|nr:unnamed protein product [Rotaria sp. Silwood1]CAF1283612.1 unnamed protein product [Rotaria sp. Silwood1]CAF3503315.1 unnamed protein product [Rotaria sp. Silwood1]CAF4664016.1 unnamed protein product [Rotaria sp. Silwood1]
MIKYLREKIIGRPAVFSLAGDIPIDDHTLPIKKTNSQDGLNDVVLLSTTSNDTTNQVEKFNAISNIINSGRRPIPSSSPIIIPKKPPRSNASSHSSSSYTSVADQMSSFFESFVQTDDVPNSTFPTLPSTCQQLEHSAARDRISVKNKRRHPIKQKLSTLRETDDNESDLFSSKTEDDEIPPPLPPKQRYLLKNSFSLPTTTRTNSTTKTKMKKLNRNLPISSTPEEEHSIIATTRIEPKRQQPLIDLSDLDTARARLRISVRSRDRSADNILLATNSNLNNETLTTTSSNISTFSNPIQRSVSFKRVQEINDIKLINRSILKQKKEENNENVLLTNKSIENNSILINNSIQNENINEQTNINNTNSIKSISHSSSHEHIYDNLDVFKRPKPNIILSSNDDDDESLSTTTTTTAAVVKTREHPIQTTRLRPLTMHVTSNNDKQLTNEFENVFNQLKKRGSIRRVRTNEETISESFPSASSEEIHVPLSPSIKSENESFVSTNKIIEPIHTPPPTPNRRKTVVGVHLSANNKVATNDNKPTPSWVDIAKQKQNKFQLVSNEKKHQDEFEQQSSIESPVPIRKSMPSADTRSNRKSMFEQTTTQTNTHPIERDSIRALKAGNPNRINNLIQFFDK